MPFERLPVITTDARGEFPVSIIPETTPVCEGHRILNGHLLEFACVRTLECGRSACLDASESRNCSATACCDCCGEAKKLWTYRVHCRGGAVRDMIIDQRRPGDWDIATSATPAEVSSCFEHVVPTGLAHGTVTVIEEGMSIEVTTYRHDGPYVDGRRPEHVVFWMTSLPILQGGILQ